MPALAQRVLHYPIKALLIGNSGAGKTGTLASLAEEYELGIVDADNGLDALQYHTSQNLLSRIHYVTYRNKMKPARPKPVVKGEPDAINRIFDAIDKWPTDPENPDPGWEGTRPDKWGLSRILVLDSLTWISRAAFQWADKYSNVQRDNRAKYGTAQDLIMDLLATVTDESFNTNVLVISHIDYPSAERDKQGNLLNAEEMKKGFVKSIGKAIGPTIPTMFNTLIASETSTKRSASGATKGQMVTKREFITIPTASLDLKNPRPGEMRRTYPIESGMRDIFRVLRSQPPPAD